jgi:hypothetical protein
VGSAQGLRGLEAPEVRARKGTRWWQKKACDRNEAFSLPLPVDG